MSSGPRLRTQWHLWHQTAAASQPFSLWPGNNLEVRIYLTKAQQYLAVHPFPIHILIQPELSLV